MNKKSISSIGIVLLIWMFCLVLLSSCGLFGSGGNDDGGQSALKEYTIQYTDDIGTHTITVIDGATYSLEVLPERTGYNFLGLFDAEVGGTQYVNAKGTSLAPFTDKKNLVLFPQYKAKEYTLVLDYQGAAVMGERSYTVKYDGKLPELPKNLVLEHSEFMGWFTEENCGGIQVADAYGLIPDKSTVDEKIFDIGNEGEYLYLYAGFGVEKFTVMFNFGSGIPAEEIEVEYNTPISEVVPSTRNEDGFAVLSWSKTQSGSQIFTGNVTDGLVLYAIDWAPVIEFNTNGGKKVTPIVAKAGSTLSLPQAERENYKFLYWEDMNGKQTDITKMPAESMLLKAVWQAMLVFDENGGTAVKDISEPVGTTIELPVPEKDGFIFAGWYTEDEKEYTATSMPSEGKVLKAGWYESKTISKTFLSESQSIKMNPFWGPKSETYEVNLKKLIPDLVVSEKPMDIHVNLFFQTRHEVSGTKYNPSVICTLSRSTSTGSNDTFLSKQFDSNMITAWQQREMRADLQVSNGLFYIVFKVYDENGDNCNAYVSDFYITIEYPDTTNLYL